MEEGALIKSENTLCGSTYGHSMIFQENELQKLAVESPILFFLASVCVSSIAIHYR